jgi:hypothetical protein
MALYTAGGTFKGHGVKSQGEDEYARIIAFEIPGARTS